MEKLLYEKLSNERNPKLNIVTDIVERDGVRLVKKRPYTSEAAGHIHRVFAAYQGLKSILAGSDFSVNESRLTGDVIESQYLSGPHIGPDNAAAFVNAVTKAYMPHAAVFASSKGFEEVFGQADIPSGVLAAPFVDIDLIFDNIIDTSTGWQIIDYEWTFDFLIPINYIFYRAIKFSALPKSAVAISEDEWAAYEKMEEHFQYEYCFKGVKNLHEIYEHMAYGKKTRADFTIASRDYEIAQLKELICAKDVHIRNIEALNEQIRLIYENTVNTKGYQLLEDFRAFKDTLLGRSSPARDAHFARKLEKKQARLNLKEAKKQAKDKKDQVDVAVHLHLYYEDLLDEFISYFSNIPVAFDLYISCQENADLAAIRTKTKALAFAKKVDIRPLVNRGRDLAPLYVEFASELASHKVFLHVHTKKSLYSGAEKGGWRHYSLDTLLGSSHQVQKILDLFDSENAGLVYPDKHEEVPVIAYSWLKNAGHAKQLARDYGLGQLPQVFNYPTGSFFWASTQALEPLLAHGYTYDDFPEEAGQTDGTLAHALERIIPFVSRKQGFDDFILDGMTGSMSKNKSLKPYESIFAQNLDSLAMDLSSKRVVSFDVFDTLITRSCLKPYDVFHVVGQLVKERYGLDCDFNAIRIASEVRAKEIHGHFCNIDHIYQELAKNQALGQYAQEIKQIELDTEFHMCMPRADMVEVFNRVKAAGCRVILVSDMYLRKSDIVAMLSKCGITGYDEFFLSNEVGARKDDGSIWQALLSNMAPSEFVHVGDNFMSDSQMLMDMGYDSRIVLNPIAELELSEFAHLKNIDPSQVTNIIITGQAICGGIFNSPFAYELGGNLHFKDIYDFGYACLGPLMASFVQWLVAWSQKKDEKLLLLAREGYILEQLIDIYCKAKGCPKPDASYFLTSRRAVTVPAITGREDLQELLSQKYQGTFSNLLKERLGLSLHPGDEDLLIDYDTPLDKLMELMQPYEKELKAQVKKEKTAYLNYAAPFLTGNKDIAVADVGFSGTIQYFLMKLTGRDIKGHYLCLHSNKPEKIGGTADAIYTITDRRDIEKSKLLNYQLFLENALSAPSGQLISFTMTDGYPRPSYKDDDYVSSQVRRLQQGIMDFVAYFGVATRGLSLFEMPKPALVEDIFYDIIASGTLTEDIAAHLTVEDSYSRGGLQRFDVTDNTWKVD